MSNPVRVEKQEIISIDGCQGYGVLVTRALTPAEGRYVRAASARAEMKSGHPWVSAANTDGEMLAAIRDYWAVRAPGWLVDSTDDSLRDLHAHSSLTHHLPHGCVLLDAERLAAWRMVEADPALGNRVIESYLGHSSGIGMHRIADLLLTDGSCLVSSHTRLDVDAHDRDDTRFYREPTHGAPIATALLAGEAQS